MQFMSKIPWIVIIIACLSLGLAPFNPPHIYEKFIMLINGELRRFIDWFDLIMHSTPWILLIMKAISEIR